MMTIMLKPNIMNAIPITKVDIAGIIGAPSWARSNKIKMNHPRRTKKGAAM
jgi:hypothetical protein